MSKVIKEKINEVESHISDLKKLAEKHFTKKRFEPYRAVCDSILTGEKQLAQLKKELEATNKVKRLELCRTAQFKLRRVSVKIAQ